MYIIRIFTIATLLMMASCQTAHKVPDRIIENSKYQEHLKADQHAQTDALHQSLVDNSNDFFRMQHNLRNDLEKKGTAKKALVAIAPTYNPLDAVNISLDVDNGDVQHVLQALAKQAGMNLLLHPSLASSKRKISLHFFKVPASTVFKEILRITDLHGESKGNLLIINPFEEKIMSVNFIESTVTGAFSTGGDVLGSGQGSSGSGGGSGGGSSSNSLTGSFSITGSTGANSNPYDQLEDMLKRLVGGNASSNANSNGGDVSSAASLRDVGQKSVLQSAKQVATAKYVLNRRAGTLYIQAKPSVVSAVSKIIERYREVLGRQILLEAQIMEVRLNDKFQYGIDWANLRGRFASSYAGAQQLGNVIGTLPNGAPTPAGITIPSGGLGVLGRMLGLSFGNSSLQVTVNLLKGYGDVHVLSNPTIRAMNAQPSLISVGRTNAYIAKTSVTTTTGVTAASGIISTDVTVNSVFNGLILGVIPSVNDQEEITLSIHPVQSEVDQNSIDTLISVGGNSKITLPRVDIKEISTTIQLNDGDTVILGGLIDKSTSSQNEGVPLLSDMPLLGYLFKAKKGSTTVRELVIVLRVHLL